MTVITYRVTKPRVDHGVDINGQSAVRGSIAYDVEYYHRVITCRGPTAVTTFLCACSASYLMRTNDLGSVV
jgi:hypothetical protein